MNELQVFQNSDFGEIRTMLIDGEPWFVGKDVAIALGYANTVDAIKVHVELDDKIMGSENATPSVTDNLGRFQYPTWINESGLYSLILSSKLPKAKQFKRWVTHEVLPTIRKTGEYKLKLKQKRRKPVDVLFRQNINIAKSISENTGVKEGIAFAAAIERTEKISGEDLSIFKRLIPAAEHNIGYLNATELGKKIGCSAKETNKMLEHCGLTYKDEKGQQRLTEEGRMYGEEYPFVRNGHAGYQIRWNEEILKVISLNPSALKKANNILE